MSKSMIDTIFARRSIRKYTSEPVSHESIRTLLEAAMAAPSASNRKPWQYVVVTERETLDALAEAHPHGKMLSEAPLAVAVCGDLTEMERYWVQDCSAATENVLLAVTALDLGAVWLGVFPRDERVSSVRRILDLPEHIMPLNVIAIGHPAEEKSPRTQFDESRVHWERW